jgi:hypothetical protein
MISPQRHVSCSKTGMLPVIGICASVFASIGFISHLLRKAPVGWEDAGGFHFRDPAPADNQAAVPVRSSAIFRGDVVRTAPAVAR